MVFFYNVHCSNKRNERLTLEFFVDDFKNFSIDDFKMGDSAVHRSVCDHHGDSGMYVEKR